MHSIRHSKNTSFSSFSLWKYKRVSDVPALYHSGPTIPAPIWKITGRAGRVSFPAQIFENPSGPIFETIPFDEIAEITKYLVLLFDKTETEYKQCTTLTA